MRRISRSVTLSDTSSAAAARRLGAEVAAELGLNEIKAGEAAIVIVEAARNAVIYGVDSEARISERVPTICFNIPNVLPQIVTETAARAGIGIRDGHMYAPRLMKRMGLAKETGMVRVSLVHYNTVAEIHRFAQVLQTL